MIAALDGVTPVIEGERHYIAPDAQLIGKIRLADGASVWFGAILRGDNEWIEIGRDSNVQDGAILHTDPGIPLNVGARVTIGHRAMLHGCTIGDGSLIGIGSTILNHARIGRESIVGAHALVTEGKEFPDGVLIVGAPARVQRELTSEERAQLAAAADIYVQNSRRFNESYQVIDD